MGVTGGPAWPAARAPGGRLRDVDARLVLTLAVVFGALVWRAGAAANAVYALFLTAVLAAGGASRREASRLLRAGAWFALLWGGVKLAVDLAAATPPRLALAAAALLCVRLAVLLLLGSAVMALVTPRALGSALASLTRPVLRDRAWTVALALLLMLHFIPRSWAAFQGARDALRVRRVQVSPFRALVLTVETGARNLARATWDQALAVSARRLDEPGAWVSGAPVRWGQWCAGAAVAGLACAAAWAL